MTKIIKPDFTDDPYDLPNRVEVKAEISVANAENVIAEETISKESAGVQGEFTHVIEQVAEDPRLTKFHADYDRWSESMKQKCSWSDILHRLLKDNGHYLELAMAMEQGGILFGVDDKGNPLIADGGAEPIMKDMNYDDTRQAVLFKTEGDQQVATGYEMFPYAVPMLPREGEHDKSPEILAFETFTNKFFVGSPDKKERRSSWLESGETPLGTQRIAFNPKVDYSYVAGIYNDPLSHSTLRGVRRLLRVKA